MKVDGSSPSIPTFGTLAQLVEHRPEESGVTGSNPVGTTITKNLHTNKNYVSD